MLLHGDRGIGKTSVLLSVINACTRGDPSLVPPPPELSKDTGGTEDKSAEIAAEIERIERENVRRARIQKTLNDIRCRVLWLEPLDMEPLPGPTNLLAAVLARIDGLARSFLFPDTKNPSERRGPAGILESCPDSLGALQEFQRLQSDVALAWDGNLPARGARLDPDSYGVEVLRAERARLSLNRNLRSALDALADTVFRGCGVHNPLFVLPVDDVDLYPARCLEILRLLRMMSVPRLLTIVLGDMDLIELVLNLKYSGEFSALVSADYQHDLISIGPEHIKSRAGSVSANAMRKLLPFAQRIRMERMHVHESLNFRPASPLTPGLPRLHDLLALCDIELPALAGISNAPAIKTARDFLLFRAHEKIRDGHDVSKDDLEGCCYSPRAILRMAPRNAADWWFSLEELVDRFGAERLTGKGKQEQLLNLLGTYCRSTINDDPLLSPENRQKYREALRVNPATGKWELFSSITSIPETSFLERLFLDEIQIQRMKTSEGETNGITAQRSISFHVAQGWRLYPLYSERFHRRAPLPVIDLDERRNELARLNEGLYFSRDTSSALVLFHDLQALGLESGSIKYRMKLLRPLECWAITEYSVGDTFLGIPWPVPAFPGFFEYEIFLDYWRKSRDTILGVHRDPGEEVETATHLVYAWIDAAAAVFNRDGLLVDFSKGNPGDKEWQELAEKMVKQIHSTAKPRDSRALFAQEWLTSLGAFLTEHEFSVIDNKHREYFNVEDLKKYWSQVEIRMTIAMLKERLAGMVEGTYKGKEKV